MKKLIVCLLVVLVLAGCVQPQAEEKTEEDVEEQTVEEQITKTVETKPTDVLSDEIKEIIEAQLTAGVKYSDIIPNHLKLKYGEKGVFGVGVQNIQNADDDYLISVTFDKAYDKYMNTIPTSEEMMNGWIKTNLEVFTLPKGETQIISIVIEVGDVVPGIKPQEGTYTFDLKTLYKRGGYHANKELVGTRAISIRVEK